MDRSHNADNSMLAGGRRQPARDVPATQSAHTLPHDTLALRSSHTLGAALVLWGDGHK